MLKVLVPTTLTWDKFATLFSYVVLVAKTTLDQIEVLFEETVNPREAVRNGAYDIDVIRPYNQSAIMGYRCPQCEAKVNTARHTVDEKRRCTKCSVAMKPVREYGSAVHRLAIEAGIGAISGVGNLVKLANGNNDTGNLKAGPQSYVWLIRECYELPHNVPFVEHRMNVIRMFWPVMESYLAASGIDLDAVEGMTNPFTADGYESLMRIERRLPEEISERLSVFNAYFDRAQERRARTREKAAEGYASTRAFNLRYLTGGGTVLAHLVESDDQRIRNAYFDHNPDVSILVIRGSDGSYGIFARNSNCQDFRQLAQALQALEPEKWFYDERPDSPMLLNGSRARNKVPSTIKPVQLITIMQVHYQHRNKYQQNELRRELGKPVRSYA